jgi:nitrogen-specific signal transduction histidine kinase
VNINTLLNRCLNKAIVESSRLFPDFTFIAKEEFDRTVTMVLAVPEDLGNAFYHLMINAIHSMKTKKDLLGNIYTPMMKIGTMELHNRIEIIIHDNGQGVPQDEANDYFSSFIESHSLPEMTKRIEENHTRLHLFLAYDIVTHLYGGTIEIDTKFGDYLELTIIIPSQNSSRSA